jgi:hypothetical protein
MNSGDYSAWMERAFLYVEGTLLQRAAEESPTRITEDFVRQALIDGLKAAKSEYANFVKMEETVPWNRSQNVLKPNAKFGRGRSKQHDVSVKRDNKIHLVCELKWLKSDDADAVMEDMWKLALTHSVAAKEKDCIRTFLLVGGLRRAFQRTLENLHRRDVLIRWSPQGNAAQLPRPTRINFGRIQRTKWGFGLLTDTLQRRKSYHRHPPPVWKELRCSVLARSWKTIRGAEWKIAVWELDFRKPCKKKQINWNGLSLRLAR